MRYRPYWSVFCLLLPLAALAQSPWPRSKAGFFAQLSFQTIPAYTSVFGDDGESTPLGRSISENALQLYGEYGLSARTTLVGSLPLRRQTAGETAAAGWPTAAGSLTGIGNASLALRHNFSKKDMPLTATLRVDLPTNDNNQATGLRAGYNAFTVLPMLSTGKGYGHVYWFAYGGYGIRTQSYSHFVDAGAEVGLRVHRIWVMAFSEWVLPLENGDQNLGVNNEATRLFVNNQGYGSIGLKTLISLNRFWGLSASAAGAAWGRNVPAQPAFSAGVYFKWD